MVCRLIKSSDVNKIISFLALWRYYLLMRHYEEVRLNLLFELASKGGGSKGGSKSIFFYLLKIRFRTFLTKINHFCPFFVHFCPILSIFFQKIFFRKNAILDHLRPFLTEIYRFFFYFMGKKKRIYLLEQDDFSRR